MKINMIYSKLIYSMNQNQGGKNMVMAFMMRVRFQGYYHSKTGAINKEFDDLKMMLHLRFVSLPWFCLSNAAMHLI